MIVVPLHINFRTGGLRIDRITNFSVTQSCYTKTSHVTCIIQLECFILC